MTFIIKILIVEDETQERRFLCDHIDWGMVGGEVINDAWNGKQAIEMVMASRPDIIITDVKMPGMNGVEMAKLVQAIDPSIKIIFNSAYDDFEYAREAANLHAFGYVLKPNNDEELLTLVKKAADKCIYEQMQEAKYTKLQHNLSTSGPLLREALTRELLLGAEMKHMELLRHAGLDWLSRFNSRFVLVLAHWENHSVYKPANFKQEAEGLLSEFHDSVIIHVSSNEAALLLHIDAEQDLTVLDSVERFCAKIVEQVQAKHNPSIRLACSNVINEIESLHHQFVDLSKKLEMQSTYKHRVEQLQQKPVLSMLHPEVMQSFKAELAKILRIRESSELCKFIQRFYEENFHDESGDLAYYSGIGFCILSVMADIVKGMGYEPFKNIDDEIHCWIGLVRLHTIKGINLYVLEQSQSIMAKLNESKKAQGNQLIEQVEQIVQMHYQEPLTVEYIAGLMHFTPNYLGAVFKAKKNISLTDYINKIRVNKSMELLHDPTLSISEISVLCGYENPPYFHRMFKKHARITPGEFRAKQDAKQGCNG